MSLQKEIKEADELINQINNIRSLMISTGMRKGFTDLQTLKYSEELDKLLNKYQLINLSFPYKS
ncbi:aspartyl-phosphate phosphatase Spo0E family protein [Pseudobacillus sp. FSL P4-0506]|uniref:aspartyl-phosphate phosphatase Spo0E family protein n=1 Tax=Pseudobacillus sp. FSL P4-0506 TaxID=2921576 RepID=UPI0030FC04CA